MGRGGNSHVGLLRAQHLLSAALQPCQNKLTASRNLLSWLSSKPKKGYKIIKKKKLPSVAFDPRHVFTSPLRLSYNRPEDFASRSKDVVLTRVPLLTQWPRVEIPPARQLAGTAAVYELSSPSRHANALVSILSISAQTLMQAGSSAP